jgi:hypothetical protein
MGDNAYSWFGIIPSAARAVDSVIESKKRLRVGSAHQETFGEYIDGEGDDKKKGIKVDKNHIQQSTKAGGDARRQWWGGADWG